MPFINDQTILYSLCTMKSYFDYQSSFHIMHKNASKWRRWDYKIQLQKNKVGNKSTNATKIVLAAWIKSTNYEKLKSENSTSK